MVLVLLWIASIKIKVCVALAKIADKIGSWAMHKAKESLKYGDYLLTKLK